MTNASDYVLSIGRINSMKSSYTGILVGLGQGSLIWRWIDKSISQQNFQMVKGADKLFHKSWMVCDRATFPDFEFFFLLFMCSIIYNHDIYPDAYTSNYKSVAF